LIAERRAGAAAEQVYNVLGRPVKFQKLPFSGGPTRTGRGAGLPTSGSSLQMGSTATNWSSFGHLIAGRLAFLFYNCL
jgi:hypothetical protein